MTNDELTIAIEHADHKLKAARQEHDELTRERDRRNYVGYLGRYFVYQNASSSGDRWPMYIRVNGLDEDARPLIVQCQMVPDYEGGVGQFQVARERAYSSLFDVAKEISEVDYLREVGKLLAAARDVALESP